MYGPRPLLLALSCLVLLAACGPSPMPSAALAPATPGVNRTGGALPPSPASAPPPLAAPGDVFAGEALVEQAVTLLLAHYVAPLASGALYRAAYGGAVAARRAAGAAPAAQALAFTDDPTADAARFRPAYLALATPATDQAALAHAAIRALVAALHECHTRFLLPDEQGTYAALFQRADYAGLGVLIRTRQPPFVIGEVFPDSPAAQAGLRPEDTIARLDGREPADLASDLGGPLARGPAGRPVTLTVRRPGEAAAREIPLAYARLRMPVVSARLVPGPDGAPIGYLKLYAVAVDADQDVQRALEDFARQGAAGWVLDVRNNPGGAIDTMARIASRFVPDERPLLRASARGGVERDLRSDPRLAFAPARPLAILINGGTGSAAEMLAAGLQDAGAGRLFGQVTVGCVAIADVFDLADGSALAITTRAVVSPRRRPLNGVGVAPDEVVPADPSGAADPALAAALRWFGSPR